MSTDLPGHGTTATIRQHWLSPCGHCDAGLPMSCTCPIEDHRGVIAALCDALDVAAPTALRDMANRIDRGPTFPLPPSVISALVRERATDLDPTHAQEDTDA